MPRIAMIKEVASLIIGSTAPNLGHFLPLIKDACRHLGTLEAVAIKRFAASEEQEGTIAKVVERCGLPRRTGTGDVPRGTFLLDHWEH